MTDTTAVLRDEEETLVKPASTTRSRFRNLLGRDDDDGLSVIEMLVVVLIISVLAASQFPNIGDQRKKTNDANLKRDLHNTAIQIESWLNENPTGNPVTPTPTPGPKVNASNGATVRIVASTAAGATTADYCIYASHPQSSAAGNATAGTGALYVWKSSAAGLVSTSPTTANCA